MKETARVTRVYLATAYSDNKDIDWVAGPFCLVISQVWVGTITRNDNYPYRVWYGRAYLNTRCVPKACDPRRNIHLLSSFCHADHSLHCVLILAALPCLTRSPRGRQVVDQLAQLQRGERCAMGPPRGTQAGRAVQVQHRGQRHRVHRRKSQGKGMARPLIALSYSLCLVDPLGVCDRIPPPIVMYVYVCM